MIDTIYIEDGVRSHPRTLAILNKYSNARHINIERYGEVFNKRSQNFRLQKRKPALILAHKYSGHVLAAPEGFGIGGSKNFYFAHMTNCLYDCRYCFLQGMYTSANYILFVNFENFDEQIERLILKNPDQSLTFFSGYDCDSLALENVTGFVAHILPLFKKHSSALLELRTKSIQMRPLDKMTPIDNCVVAFSLMPDVMANALDHKAPSITSRLEVMRKFAERGWKVGLRFDPLIYGKNWEIHYQKLFARIFEIIPESSIHSVSYGPLRFPHAMYQKIFKLYPNEELFSGPLPERNGVVAYKSEIEKEMADFCREAFSNFVRESIIFQCTPEAQAIGIINNER